MLQSSATQNVAYWPMPTRELFVICLQEDKFRTESKHLEIFITI